MAEKMYIDTWHVQAVVETGEVWTSYGLNEEVARRQAEIIRLVKPVSITLVHTTKKSRMARWVNEKFVILQQGA